MNTDGNNMFATIRAKLEAGASRHRIVERLLAQDFNANRATKLLVTTQKVRLILGLSDADARSLVSEMLA